MRSAAGNEVRDRVIRAAVSRLACALRCGLVLAGILCVCSIAPAQSPNQSGSGNGTTGISASQHGFGRPGMGSLSPDDENYDPMMAERRMRALNAERQKQMVSDAARLLKLAQELNSEIASANTGAFTPDQLRKIGEIERLARNVREKMTSAAGETPSVLPPPGPTYPVR
jgi:hypothetical protein